MRKITLILFTIFCLLNTLIIYQIPVEADDNTGNVPLQMTWPEPLTPQLSVNGTTLFNALPLKAVVNDLNPSTSLRHIPAPTRLTDQPEAATASFSITYIPNGSTDLWGEACYTFPEIAKTAFNAAANILANTLNSTVPITINACWGDLESSSILGYSGGVSYHRDFLGATRANTWYAASLANALHGSDLDSGKPEIHTTYNLNFSWYYGTDGNTPFDQHDLMTVMLHEITHGLNFSGSMRYASGVGSWGFNYPPLYPNIYDVFIRDGSGIQLIDTIIYPNGSTALGDALVSNNIWFHGSQAMAANGDRRVKMYAPSTWSSGSSYAHLDYDTFNNTPNQLMVYSLSAGESIHDPGVITRGLLRDLGWTTSNSSVSSVTTQSVSSIGTHSATGNGTIIFLGSPNPTQHGVCWNTSGNPTTTNSCTQQGAVSSTGAFTSSMTGLSGNTTYYVRSYATNTAGTAYGNEVFFTTSASSESSAFPWVMFLPAIFSAGEGCKIGPLWGVYTNVCCPSSSVTFSATISGKTKRSITASCEVASTWDGWQETTAGTKSVFWQVTSSTCGTYSGTFPWVMEKGKFYWFQLELVNMELKIIVYIGDACTVTHNTQVIESHSLLDGTIGKKSIQKVKEITLDIPPDVFKTNSISVKPFQIVR